VTNEPLATWPNIDKLCAIDPSIWSVALENMLTDDDSYINKGADFMGYRNPIDGRFFILQTDANETFTQATWSITRNFTAGNKPFLSHVLAVPELRQRYMAHYRTVKTDFNWAYFEPIFNAHKALIDAAVQGRHEEALPVHAVSVELHDDRDDAGRWLGWREPDRYQAVCRSARHVFTNSNPELNAAGPSINSVLASNENPDPSEPVTITANVTPVSGGITKVELFYRLNPTDRYERTLMTAGPSNNYSVLLPVTAKAGQIVKYYVGATAGNTNASMSFKPTRTEWAPNQIDYTFGNTGGMRITEWMYSGASGEFIEFTNMSGDPVDMAGWSFDDDHRVAGAFALGAFGVVQPGESVVITEANAETFRTAWGLPATIKIIGGLGTPAPGPGGNNLARNDELNLYDATGALIDRLAYGDQTYPGTIRTQNASGQTCSANIGQNDIDAWVLSTLGDGFGSVAASTAELGTPGSYNAPACPGVCVADCDVSGTLNIDDFICFQTNFALGDPSADCDASGSLNIDDFICFQTFFALGC
jgi:hypothetical protein